MNTFLCAMRLDGLAIGKPELFGYMARLPRHDQWDSCNTGAFAGVALAHTHAIRPLTARYRNVLGVGDVRLDNREELGSLAGVKVNGVCDLELVLAAIDRCGPDVVPRILGDFSFVAWDAAAQKLIAARDAFGVKPLFYRRTREHLALSSRLEPLCGAEEIDTEYVADFLIGLPGPSPRTIWRDTVQLEPGVILVQRGSVAAQSRYWSAHSFEPAARANEGKATERFRELFLGAVRQRVARGETWAQLSGGLDSSSVVSAAEWLRETFGAAGLSGTVTLSDSLGTGDERRYSDQVVQRYGLRNEVLWNYGPWRMDGACAPAASDEPSPLFPFYTRDQHTVERVAQNGGRVLLSGLGSDHYMYGTLSYMADMLVRGSIRATGREVLGWAMQTRRSFWSTARANVLNPILYNVSRRKALAVPCWMSGEFARRHRVLDRLAEIRSPHARLGRLFSTHSATELARVSNWVQRGPFQDDLEVRYPFLSRELVEFTLQLPVSMKVRPQGRKWVLRQAMRGILPEGVRTRTHKGGIDARILATLEQERRLIDALTADPCLAQLGCVDRDELRKTIELARRGDRQNTVHVLSVLALESWLRARNDAWPAEVAARQTAA